MFDKYDKDIERLYYRLDSLKDRVTLLEEQKIKLSIRIRELEAISTYPLKTGKKILRTFLGVTSTHNEYKDIPLKEVLVQLLKRIHLKIDYEPVKESTIKFSRE